MLAPNGLRVPKGGNALVPTSALLSSLSLCLEHPPRFSVRLHLLLSPRCGPGGGALQTLAPPPASSSTSYLQPGFGTHTRTEDKTFHLPRTHTQIIPEMTPKSNASQALLRGRVTWRVHKGHTGQGLWEQDKIGPLSSSHIPWVTQRPTKI